MNIIFFNKIQIKAKNLINTLSTSTGLKGRIARGGIWLGVGSGTEHTLRLVRNIALTRILAPEAFGIMSIIIAINTLFVSFTEMGIMQAIVQNPKGDKDTYLNGAFWVSFGRGLLIYFVIFIIAPWLASFYESPEIALLLRISSLTLLLSSANNPKAFIALKNMNYKIWVIIQNSGGVLGPLTAIISGIFLKNVWALVLGILAEEFVRFIFSYLLVPYFPRFKFEKETFQSLLNFIKGMVGLPIITFLFNRADVFVLGKLISKSELGKYTIAYGLAQASSLLFSTFISPMLLPVFSSLQDDRAAFERIVLKFSFYISCIFLPLLTIASCASPHLLAFLYGKAYASVSVTFMILCACIAVLMIGEILMKTLYAIGKPQYSREISLVRLVIMIAIIYPFIIKFGLIGAASARLLASVAWLFIFVLRMNKLLAFSAIKFIYAITPGVVISIIIFTIWFFLNKFDFISFHDNISNIFHYVKAAF